MRVMLRVTSFCGALAAAAALVIAVWPDTGEAQRTPRLVGQPLVKAIWGPPTFNGASEFPVFKDLGVDLYQVTLNWNQIAKDAKPARPTDPRDPGYVWPAALENTIAEARRNGIDVLLLVQGGPRWSNNNHDPDWGPRNIKDYTDFLQATARKYPTVRHWMLWGEPSVRFHPLPKKDRGQRVSVKEAGQVRRYARMVDASYSLLKRRNRRNLVIAGNTFVGGDIRTREWIRHMKLPGGRPPRMDLYGHNPYGFRVPDLCDAPGSQGIADFSAIGDVAVWADRYLGKPRRKNIPVFISEFGLPNPKGDAFGYSFTAEEAADRLRRAVAIARGVPMIWGLGYWKLRDTPGAKPGDRPRVSLGLLGVDGQPKPTYQVFKQARKTRGNPPKCAPRIPRRR